MSAHVHERLAYYRDLSPEERREVDLHLAACVECRETLVAYRRQDTALAAIPRVHARRRALPASVPPWRRALSYAGDALALAGLGLLVWAAALQFGPGGSIRPATPAPEPGIALPPAEVSLPSPWPPALPWLAGALLVVGALFVFSRRNAWPPLAGAVLSVLLLVDFVPPFSSLPNPAGLYWRVAPGYSYDPRLPFKNEFVVQDAPERRIVPRLNALIGAVGLAPLDPAQPLARYEFLRVGLDPSDRRVALVTTRFVYADGSSRLYPVPLFQPTDTAGGFWLSGWQDDGLQRLRSEHLAFPGQPFATAASPVRLGAPAQLALSADANRLDEGNPGHWLWDSARVQRLAFAPDGRSFLMRVEEAPGRRQLWRVPLDGTAPVAVGPAGDILEYAWSPDRAWIVYTRQDARAGTKDATRPYVLVAVARDAPAREIPLIAGLPSARLPGLDGEGAWLFSGDALWVVPYSGAGRLVARGVMPAPSGALPPRPAPDGTRAAYACGSALCVLDVRTGMAARVADLGAGATASEIVDIAWSPDGTRCAVVTRDPNDIGPVRLSVVTASGAAVLARDIAPGEASDPPQWAPDGGALFVQTYPHRGRRIIALDLRSGTVLDLSREHWDAYLALAPDGQTLLLNNGRGDFWSAPVLRAP